MPIKDKFEEPKDYKRLTADDLSFDGCMMLLEAFVQSISVEYNIARKCYKAHPNDEDTKKHFNNVRNFIKSKHFQRMTGLCADAVLDILDSGRSSNWRSEYYVKVLSDQQRF